MDGGVASAGNVPAVALLSICLALRTRMSEAWDEAACACRDCKDLCALIVSAELVHAVGQACERFD